MIVAKALKKDSQGNRKLVKFDPNNREVEIGVFIVIRQPRSRPLLIIDESGMYHHDSLVYWVRVLGEFATYRGELRKKDKQIIRGGRYSRYTRSFSRQRRGSWQIEMVSMKYGKVWEDLRNKITEIIIGHKGRRQKGE